MVWKVMAVQRVMWSTSIFKLQEYNGFRQSWKLFRNLCSLRFLRPNIRRVRNANPFGSKILYMLVWTGQIKGNNLLLNIGIDSEFLMLRFKLDQSFRVEGKKSAWNKLQFVRQLKVGILLFLVLVLVLQF